jgi:hypothetical protein
MNIASLKNAGAHEIPLVSPVVSPLRLVSPSPGSRHSLLLLLMDVWVFTSCFVSAAKSAKTRLTVSLALEFWARRETRQCETYGHTPLKCLHRLHHVRRNNALCAYAAVRTTKIAIQVKAIPSILDFWILDLVVTCWTIRNALMQMRFISSFAIQARRTNVRAFVDLSMQRTHKGWSA